MPPFLHIKLSRGEGECARCKYVGECTLRVGQRLPVVCEELTIKDLVIAAAGIEMPQDEIMVLEYALHPEIALSGFCDGVAGISRRNHKHNPDENKEYGVGLKIGQLMSKRISFKPSVPTQERNRKR